MKDYRLSEIVVHCKEMHDKYGENACELCDREVSEFCIKEFENCPSHWDDIKPRDMVELPCKIEVKYAINYSNWQVVWRNRNGNGSLMTKMLETEPEADEFLAELGGDIRNGL